MFQGHRVLFNMFIGELVKIWQIIAYEWWLLNFWIYQEWIDVSCRCDESIKPLIAISVYFVGSRLSQLLISSQEPLTLSNQNFDSKIFENYLPKNTRSSTFRNANRFNHRHTFLLLWCQSKTLFISDQWSVFKWGDHHEIQQPRTWESLPKLCAHIAHIILLYGLCHIIHMIWRPNYWRINQIFTIWCSSLAHFQTSHNDTTWIFNRMFSNLHFCLLVYFVWDA